MKLFYDQIVRDSEKHDAFYFLNYHAMTALHNHDYWEFFIALTGRHLHVLNGKEEILETGAAYLIRPEDTHSLAPMDEDSSHINIPVRASFFEGLAGFLSEALLTEMRKAEKLTIRLTEVQIQQIMGYGNFLASGDDPEKVRISTSLLVSKLLDEVIEQNFCDYFNRPRWLTNLTGVMHEWKNWGWRVRDVQEYTGYSRTHLAREFNTYFGCSVQEYLTAIKLDAAKQLLQVTDSSVKEISERLGFNSVAHFNHLIKNHYGCSPLKIRKDYRVANPEVFLRKSKETPSG